MFEAGITAYYTRLDNGFDNGRLCAEAFTQFQAECGAEDMPEEEKGKTEFYTLDATGNVYSPVWITFNLRSSYKLAKGLSLNATFENITDRRYRPYSCGISASGRNVTMSVTYTL